jgi:hypothetical protein
MSLRIAYRITLGALATLGLIAFAGRNDGPEVQHSPAIIGTVPATLVYAPVTTSSTTSSTTTSTTTPAPTTAHEALEADLADPNAFALAELDPSLPCLEWAPLALEVGWPAEQLPQLLRVIWKESRCQPAADNGHDGGLTQINEIHGPYLDQLGYSLDDRFDPRVNLMFALRLWSEREASGLCGWQPWSVSCG